ncbi:MAG TPA: hypothetical protein VGF61_11175 [Candidatus Acidoferrum sp.]|jgi:hypothetical protein
MSAALRLLLLAVAFTFFLSQDLMSTQSGPAQSTASAGNSRACTVNPVLEGNSKSKPQKKSKHPLAREPLPACLELKGEPIEVQEFLQSVVREFQWRVGENHASEDTWSFVRYLNDEELEKYADTKVLLEPVEFTGGKVAVLLRTQELSEGYVRVQISTRFQGNGKPTDKFSGQPATMWPLNSKGVLEQELIGALQTRFKHAA